MTNHDVRDVLLHIQAILNRKGLTPCQARADIGALISDKLNSGLICDKVWQKCEAEVPTIFPLIHWTSQSPISSCVTHGGVFIKLKPTTSVA